MVKLQEALPPVRLLFGDIMILQRKLNRVGIVESGFVEVHDSFLDIIGREISNNGGLQA